MTEQPTDAAAEYPGIARIVRSLGDSRLVHRLATGVTPADLTTLLLAVAAERAAEADAPGRLGRYVTDRFSRPGNAPFLHLRRIEDAFIRAVPHDWDWVTASPLVPFGTHHVLGEISQDWVVTTVRPNEVAADPTNALALEAAARRRDTAIRRSTEPQRLATIQRVTRAQKYSGDEASAHFSLLGLVTAGRSQPSEGFDTQAMVDHLSVYVTALSDIVQRIDIVLSTSRNKPGRELIAQVRRRVGTHSNVEVTEDPDRLTGQRYYSRACFKVNVTAGKDSFEICDGGFTDWTVRLLDDRRERLLISAAGLDRLALALQVDQPRTGS
jgi:hypothetical protein